MHLTLDYEIIHNNDEGYVTAVNRSEGSDLSSGTWIKLDGKKIFHVGKFSRTDGNQRRALLAAINGF